MRFISAKKGEPEWMLAWRLEAFERWQAMEEPNWAKLGYPPIDYQDLYYYAAPKEKVAARQPGSRSIPRSWRTYKKLGIPLREQEVLAGVKGAPRVAVDAVFDSVSVATTFKAELAKAGVLFMPISRGAAGASGAGAQVPGLGGAGQRQLLRLPEQRGLLRRLLRLHPAGRALPDGAVDLFPHQC